MAKLVYFNLQQAARDVIALMDCNDLQTLKDAVEPVAEAIVREGETDIENHPLIVLLSVRMQEIEAKDVACIVYNQAYNWTLKCAYDNYEEPKPAQTALIPENVFLFDPNGEN